MDNNKIILSAKSRQSKIFNIFNFFFAICFVCIAGYYLLSAPFNNKTTTIHISRNETINSISKELETKNVIRHAYILKSFITLFNFDRQISLGDYMFNSGSSTMKVAWQIAQNKHNVNPIKITFKEGMTNEEIADLLASKLSLFRKDLFLSNPQSKQGYLFPDTYFFYSMDSTDEIISEFTNNFDKRVNPLKKEITSQGKSLDDIITMASIIEREAHGEEDASTISGILWKRISLGMPLQVDVDKSTYSVKGLPNEPVNNPGLVSIQAAINPIDSPYLYYLHDKSGKVHYAVTFAEHKLNIANYLK